MPNGKPAAPHGPGAADEFDKQIRRQSAGRGIAKINVHKRYVHELHGEGGPAPGPSSQKHHLVQSNEMPGSQRIDRH